MQSICPSHTIASWLRALVIADEALSKPYSTFDFLKTSVSGELTYLPEFLDATSWRPEKPTTRPCLSRMGNMRRPLNLW